MRMFHWLRAIVPALAMAAGAAEPEWPRDQIEFFEKQIRPVLAAQCWNCHSEKKVESGLQAGVACEPHSTGGTCAGGVRGGMDLSGVALGVGEPDGEMLEGGVRGGDVGDPLLWPVHRGGPGWAEQRVVHVAGQDELGLRDPRVQAGQIDASDVGQ